MSKRTSRVRVVTGGGMCAIATLLALGSCDGSGCEQQELPIGYLEFRDPDDVLIDDESTLPTTMGFWAADLDDTLLQQPLGQVTMRYTGTQGRRSQAWAFATDLDAGYDRWRSDLDALAGSGFSDLAWSFVRCRPPNVPHVVWNGSGDARETDLHKVDFWGDYTQPCLADLLPTKVGSVKSAVVYDQGACSQVQSTTAMLRDTVYASSTETVSFVLNSFWADALLRNVRRLGVDGRAYVGPTDERRPDDVAGGFFLTAGWDFETKYWVPLTDIHVRLAYDIRLSVDEDTHEIRALNYPIRDEITGGDLPGFPPSIIGGGVQGLIRDEITKKLAEIPQKLGAAQRVDLNPDAADCEPGTPGTPIGEVCGLQMSAVGTAVNFGVLNMNAETPDMFSDADVLALGAAVADPTRWSCRYTSRELVPGTVPPEWINHHRCFFQVPIRRLNVYPHQIEAVLFDSKDVTNAAYALWVAAHAIDAGPDRDRALRRICRRAEVGNLPSNGDGQVVGYAQQSLGFEANATLALCQDCYLFNCVGCEGAPCSACQDN